MITQHFKLREQPFGVTPDPKYLYASSTHREALASLLYGLQSGLGFVSLIAKPGMGKTTLLFEVLNRLRDTRTTVFLFQSISTPVDLLRAILIDLGVKEVRENLVDLQTQLNNVLLKQCTTRKSVVVVIDEAQNLNDAVLETVRMLSNFETASQKLMQIILVGQPQLAEKLMTPGLLQLRQRISIFAHLTPLSTAETSAYIIQRLTLAGLEPGEQIFTPSAIALIARHSEGIPRNINNLCFNALSLAFALKRSRIDSGIVNEVISDLNISEQMLSAEGHPFETTNTMPSASSSEETLTSSEDNIGTSKENEPGVSSVDVLPELQAATTWQHLLNQHPATAMTFRGEQQASEVATLSDEPSPSFQPTSSTNTYQVGKTAAKDTLRIDEGLATPVVEPLLPTINNRAEPQAGPRWAEQEVPNQESNLTAPSLNTANKLRSTASDSESKSNDNAVFETPILAGFEGRSKRRTGPESWNHTAIVATLAGAALCVWLGVVDYPILFPQKANQASSKVAAPVVPTIDSQTADQTESAPSHTLQRKGSIRVRQAESLATLCNTIYGKCTPELLEQLLVLNPSLLYPNRLRPGQLISIPLDPHNAKTER